MHQANISPTVKARDLTSDDDDNVAADDDEDDEL